MSSLAFAELKLLAELGRKGAVDFAAATGADPLDCALSLVEALLDHHVLTVERRAADAAYLDAMHAQRRSRTVYGRCKCGVRGVPGRRLEQLVETGPFWCRPCLMGARR